MEAKSEKLSLWSKIGYGLGDVYGGGSGVVISFYYLIFLTDVVRISSGTRAATIEETVEKKMRIELSEDRS